jgi:hypothetical protein
MQIYKAAYRWTPEELHRALRHHRESNLRPAFVIAIGVVSSLFALLSLFLLILMGPLSPSAWPAYPFIAFALYWLFVRQRFNRWLVERNFHQNLVANQLIECEISPEKVRFACEGVGLEEYHWKAFIMVMEAHDGFLFYLHRHKFYWLPFSAFNQTGTASEAKQFIKANVVRYVRQASVRAPLPTDR